MQSLDLMILIVVIKTDIILLFYIQNFDMQSLDLMIQVVVIKTDIILLFLYPEF